ncbi:MAG: ribonuclease III, partial [Clostridia bacterium]|nr:ribonuclease III [Clostridia bacterium]
EFLGDAVLELTTSEFLYMNHPEMREGNMTKMRASLVCESTLASCARKIGLEKYILFGKGEEQTGGRNRDSIISDVMEAVIGSLYLDGGIEVAKRFIYQCVLDHYEDKILFYDSKTILQERVQEKGRSLSYELVDECGPAHDRTYKVNCMINKKKVSEGSGRTKKGAEQEAAYQALLILNEK